MEKEVKGKKVTKAKGWLRFTTGPMFAGKTTYLIRTVKYYKKILKKRVLVFKPSLDKRFKVTDSAIFNHNFVSYSSIIISDNQHILEHLKKLKSVPDIIFFDEINLFAPGFSQIILQLQNTGINVVCSGLSKDFQQQYFPEIVDFLKLKPKIKFLYAGCYKCLQPAANTKRLVADKTLILVGGKDLYAPICDQCLKQ